MLVQRLQQYIQDTLGRGGLQNATTGAVRASLFYQPPDAAHGGVSSSERAALGAYTFTVGA